MGSSGVSGKECSQDPPEALNSEQGLPYTALAKALCSPPWLRISCPMAETTTQAVCSSQRVPVENEALAARCNLRLTGTTQSVSALRLHLASSD